MLKTLLWKMEKNRWYLVKDIVNAINEHIKSCVTPSDLIRVGESMSRWYGRFFVWICVGLPYYVVMDRKPESGCEMKYTACGRRGIVLLLEIFTATDKPRRKALKMKCRMAPLSQKYCLTRESTRKV